MLVVDGSYGEGGGQILRTALALSMITGRSLRIKNIRAARSTPGLQHQHLTAVNAAVCVSRAEVSGNQLGSKEIVFQPSAAHSGEYRFSVGTAGSCMLVLQTILPALMLSDGESNLILEGGTHNPFAPPYEFLKHCYLPLLEKVGFNIDLELKRAGFYPSGGGVCEVRVRPTDKTLQSLEILQRGDLIDQSMIAVLSGLSENIGEREVNTAGRILSWPQTQRSVTFVESTGPGNVLLLMAEYENVTEVVTGFGKWNVPAEFVAKKAARQMKAYLSSDAPVGEYLSDQLLLPLSVARGGRLRCQELSQHTTTNIHTISQFLEKEIQTEPQADGTVLITVPGP